ncbi:plastocyanin/azurin family copper-binding protein [Haladaptatus sp. DYF46]|uniref:plastocyanin/azurin family copper-binding protein n=1 Tax=Haladaptatus sp. DYF46 TaxID=2886041 RepID=UPI00210774B5|nr:plastocyanin/azurin family copper-binding protein [Haladaptatus sp. DYF46]
MNHDPTRRTLLTITGATLTSASLAGCLSSATPSSTNENTSTDGSTPDKTVHVGPGGNLMFDPDELEVQPGTTIRWVWDSNNHNVVVDHQPNDADWDGSPGSKSTLHDADFSFTHTFDVPGTYDYYSKPDLAAGMTGTVVVTRSPSGTTTEESESPTESTEEENIPTREPCSVTDLTALRDAYADQIDGPVSPIVFDLERRRIDDLSNTRLEAFAILWSINIRGRGLS